MEAKELMIGDWVLIGNNHIRVTSLQEGKDYVEAQPIPLTAEILEKNGFDCNHDAKTSIDLVYHDCARITEYGEEVLEDGKMIRFVHELQHALRLCGIDKTIEI